MRDFPDYELNYDEQLFLAAYRRALGFDYSLNEENRYAHHISVDHMQGQKIGYFLSANGFLPGFCFNWNVRGPFSAKFQDLLLDIDSKKDFVVGFYAQYDADPESVFDRLLPKCLKEPLFRWADAVYKFVRSDSSDNANAQISTNLEILASLLYIATVIFPTHDFQCSNDELMCRRKSFNDTAKNKRAWEALKQTDLLSTFV